MALIILDENEIIDYVPVRERGEENPLIIRCKYVNRALALQFSDRIAERWKGVTGMEQRLKIERVVNREQFGEQVVEIKNFYDSDEETMITDPLIFYDKVDGDLVAEILDAMMSQAELTKGQSKNFGAG